MRRSCPQAFPRRRFSASRSSWRLNRQESDAEDFCIARLDRVALFFDCRGVVLHGLDVLERLAPGFLLGLRMRGPQAADVDNQLLGLAAEAERLKQSRGVRIGRILEDAVR